MATINDLETVNTIINGNGYYPGDNLQVVRIVAYNNQFDGGLAYGLIYEGEDPHRYHKSPACHNPRILWDAS